MWLCEDKLKGKTSHFRLSSASQKRVCLSSQLVIIVDYRHHRHHYHHDSRVWLALASLNVHWHYAMPGGVKDQRHFGCTE